MKKKMIVIEVMILLCFGVFAVYFHWASQAKHVTFEDLMAEMYPDQDVEVIAEMLFSISDARRWDLPGLTSDVLDRLERMEVKKDPTQQMRMVYLSLQDHEIIVYYLEFVKQFAQLSDYVLTIHHPVAIPFDEIIHELEIMEFHDIAQQLKLGNFSLEHAHTTTLVTISDSVDEFIKDELKDYLFVQLIEQDVIIFVHESELYLVISQNGTFEIVLPQTMSFEDLIHG